MSEGSIHIKYRKNIRRSMFRAYVRAVERAAEILDKKTRELKILDLGCGRGEFLEYAVDMGIEQIEGLDFDPKCVEMSSQYAKCYLCEIQDVELIAKRERYDLILMSHVLEHLEDPAATVKQLSSLASYLLISVPNPLRPNVLYFALKRYNYSNLGHYYCWDRSHFNVFLAHSGVEIDTWHIDDVRFPDLLAFRAMRRLNLQRRLEERILPFFLPYFSTSHIVLCRRKS